MVGSSLTGFFAALVLMMFLPAFRNLSLEMAPLARSLVFFANWAGWAPYASPNFVSNLVSPPPNPVKLVPLLLLFGRFSLTTPAPAAARGSIPATSPDAVPLIWVFAGWVSCVWCCSLWSCSYSCKLDSLFSCSLIRGWGLPGPPVLWAGANPEAPLRTRPLPSPAAALALSRSSGSVIWDAA